MANGPGRQVYLSTFRNPYSVTQFKSMFTPFVRSVALADIETIILFLRYGVSIRGLYESLEEEMFLSISQEKGASATRGLQLVQDVVSHFEQDPLVKLWAVGHLRETIDLLELGPSMYQDWSFASQLYDGAPRSFFLVPRQATETVKKKPHLLSALLGTMSPVHAAVALDDRDLLHAMIDSHFDFHDVDFQQITALHLAVGNITSKMCAKLIDLGLDVNAEDSLGITPLQDAVYLGHSVAVKLLLDAGASALAQREAPADNPFFLQDDYSDLWGEWRRSRTRNFFSFSLLRWSILHIAIWQGSSVIVQLLISRGTKLTVHDASGRIALDLAIELERFEIAAKLLEMGAPFDSEDLAAPLLLQKAISTQQKMS